MLDFPVRADFVLRTVEASVSKTRTDQMITRLRDLAASSPDVEASAVVSVDGLTTASALPPRVDEARGAPVVTVEGLTMASALPPQVEEDRVAAMSAAMLSLGERIANELGRGNLDQVYIKGENGYGVLMSVGGG